MQRAYSCSNLPRKASSSGLAKNVLQGCDHVTGASVLRFKQWTPLKFSEANRAAAERDGGGELADRTSVVPVMSILTSVWSDAALSQTWQIGNNGCGVKTRNFGHFQGAGAGVLVFSMFFPPGQELLAQYL